MIVEELVRWLVDVAGVAGVPIGIVVSLVAFAIYGRHVLAIGATVATGFKIAMIVAVVLAVAVATPVLDVDLGAALQLADVGADVVRYLLGLREVLA